MGTKGSLVCTEVRPGYLTGPTSGSASSAYTVHLIKRVPATRTASNGVSRIARQLTGAAS